MRKVTLDKRSVDLGPVWLVIVGVRNERGLGARHRVVARAAVERIVAQAAVHDVARVQRARHERVRRCMGWVEIVRRQEGRVLELEADVDQGLLHVARRRDQLARCRYGCDPVQRFARGEAVAAQE